jgi:hypothetical protein
LLQAFKLSAVVTQHADIGLAVLFLFHPALFRFIPVKKSKALSNSYTKRNDIIHRGETATEDEARHAITVARRVVEIMNAIPLPPPVV